MIALVTILAFLFGFIVSPLLILFIVGSEGILWIARHLIKDVEAMERTTKQEDALERLKKVVLTLEELVDSKKD